LASSLIVQPEVLRSHARMIIRVRPKIKAPDLLESGSGLAPLLHLIDLTVKFSETNSNNYSSTTELGEMRAAIAGSPRSARVHACAGVDRARANVGLARGEAEGDEAWNDELAKHDYLPCSEVLHIAHHRRNHELRDGMTHEVRRVADRCGYERS